MNKKIMLLGSGELGKEFVIAAKRYGQYVIAVDSYANAPAMQVADTFEVINMLDGNALDAIVSKHKPDIIVPEIEAIRTERFYDYEAQNIQVVPSAKAANYTMNRKAIRDLAANELKVKTAKFAYATSAEGLKAAVAEIGIPCVVKPLMSSSGKGQSVIKSEDDIVTSWNYAQEGARGDEVEVIVEEFIDFEMEITLLTITQKNGETIFCPAIGHRQERGDYQESWQPASTSEAHLEEAQDMAKKVTEALGGAGLWGVEFFITKEEVYFSELSPRPHDTGMVTMANTQLYNEFELHCKAIMGITIDEVDLLNVGASAVILYHEDQEVEPKFDGLTNALNESNTEVRLFGKPTTRKFRRMGVALTWEKLGEPVENLVERAKKVASKISISDKSN